MIIAGILIYNYFEAEAAKSATIEDSVK